MFKILLTLVIVTAAMTAGVANAASFDCAKARTPDEKAICRTRVLSDADVKMATLFKVNTHLVMMGSRGEMQDRQRAWLADRAKCASNLKCLTASYAQRNQELERDFEAIASRGPF
ncbi:hypothetical protein AEAC466_00490 [Asticcacaulis sp. AC466]|uniref:lysozyme inhibitor LprI family protein n=1 Tax=Asticcacaulis sp. AC466 TaxID=1282362 RepID=UPI0003C3FED6|nr:hypothetical protein [Asticcacaulis sp. AC466]ESQ85682.1 hypothetical protein AEAC466_00490 [Asticcacaulis sp. AC466]